MRFLLLLALIAGIVWVLVRNVQERRHAWLARLSLPGSWHGEQDGVRYQLYLQGAPGEGDYREVSEGPGGRFEESGRWRVAGHNILFEPVGGGASSCDLRLFETGRIGLHGPGRERRIYVREADNVVMLPQRRV